MRAMAPMLPGPEIPRREGPGRGSLPAMPDTSPLPVQGLPEGLTQRPLVFEDSRAVFEVMAAQEQHDTGSVEIEEADIVGDWQRPSSTSPARVGVFEGDRMVAYGEVGSSQRCDAAVDPDYRGRGIGTAVADWTQAVAAAAAGRTSGCRCRRARPVTG